MKNAIHFLMLILLVSFSGYGQVSKTNNTMACVSNSSADRTVAFTSGDFGGCTTIADVNITIHYRVTDNSAGNPGAFGVHEDLDFKLISPTGTIVPLMQHNRSAPMGCGTLLACGAGGPCEASFVGSFAYIDGTVTLDQSAAGPINRWMGTACGTSEAPSSGTYQPHEGRTLDAFNGETPVGTWTLRITDPFDNFGEWNCLMSYTLTITCAAACTDPDVPTVTYSPATICEGSNATLNIAGNLNDATQWNVYTGSCGGTLLGSTSGSTFTVTPSAPSTTYYVRGEGGCITPGSCGSVTVNVTPLDDPSFSYGASAYCVNAADPTPTITGLGGGTFTSSPAGLSINAATGQIDVSASTPNTYTVTYTTAGTCPNSSNVSVTINGLDDASFSYGTSAYCVNAADPTPTITGLGGGTFTSSPAGLSINAATGQIDVSASTPNTYTVTYTTAGTCPNSSNVSVTINPLDDPSFSYGASAYCADASNPTPTITGLGGGSFSSSPIGLIINSTTGEINLAASIPNTYTVTYTTAGTCPSSSNVSVTVTAVDDATFSYGASSYCVNDADPTPGAAMPGGTYSSSPAGLSINATTGQIDVSASTPNTYTVTYTTAGTCPNSSNVSVTINGLDDASFSYGASAYCVNAADPTPTITGLGGGTFTSSPAGLSINASTGQIDVSASTPNTYTVTYTTSGTCPNSSNVSVTINPLDDASFSYGAASYCQVASDPTPTITGLGGGTFTSSPAGLSINATTGQIDVSASTPNTYTVTYTTAGTCPNSSNVTVAVNAMDNAGFNYDAASYCASASDPTPTITGLAGGTFTSSPAGLSINAATGQIDVSASTPNTYTITYTTSGPCPNNSNQVVTITGGGAVTAVCQNVTVYLDGNGDASITASDIDGGSTIGCGTMNLTASQIAFTCSDVGAPVSVTLTVEDGLGGSDACTAQVTVLDTISPVVSCQDITVQLDSNGVATITAADVMASPMLYFTTTNSNRVYEAPMNGSGVPSIVYDPAASGAQGPVGMDYRQSTDELYWGGGNNQELWVGAADGTGKSQLSNAQGVCCEHHDVDLDEANSRYFFTVNNFGVYVGNIDGSGTATQIYPNNYSSGPNTVDYDETTMKVYTNDVSGNVILGMDDNGANLTELYNAGDGVSGPRGIVIDETTQTLYWTNRNTGDIMAAPADGSGTPTSIYSGRSGLYHITRNPMTDMLYWTEFDGSGDRVISAPADGTGTPAVLYDGSYGGIRGITLGDLSVVGASDNCGNLTSTIDVSNFDCADVGTPVSVTLTVTDDSGNSATCTSTVTVEDNIAPNVICQDVTVTLDGAGNGSIVAADIDGGSTDSCGVASVSASQTAFTCADIGTNTVTLSVTDVNGNVATCDATVTVVETELPTASNPDSLFVECVGDIPASDPSVVTDEADNCGTPTVTFSSEVSDGQTCPETITRTYTVTDGSGNSIDVTQTIVVMDTTAPTASNPATLSVQCSGDVPAPVTGWVTDEADNCGTPAVTWVSDVSDGQSCPETITRTFAVTDDCGNSINVEQLIVIQDIDAPVADDTLLAMVSHNCSISPTAPTATDNCDGTVTATPDIAFPITTPGITTITWTYMDACGNSSTQTQDVEITGVDVSTWIANDGITIVAYNQGAGITYEWIDCNANDSILPGENNYNFTPSYSSDFAVIVTENGCSDTSDCVTITGAAIDELVTSSFMLYPNPSEDGIFTVGYEGEIKSVEVMDLTGRVIELPVNMTERKVNGSALASGKYIVRILTGEDKYILGTIVVTK